MYFFLGLGKKKKDNKRGIPLPQQQLHDSPHHQKLQKSDGVALSKPVIIATTPFTTNSDDHPLAKSMLCRYHTSLVEQRFNTSLHALPGIFDF
ncbi:hypothetical protein DM01DRAFT_1332671 [Hesseltinella vesiculosa]|uniref:Uncharacterized protein n=1 Tax=Hesseltinella vesiculosa TaxID=101127 RepID=A0A1X2GSP3_9FUNG|nr:hypothetical protein DM01DRAFT_1332671 [Hesseltinella vesiculosa]